MFLFNNDINYSGRYDEKKVRIVGWEYGVDQTDGVHFSPRWVTHKVDWVRPRFEVIPDPMDMISMIEAMQLPEEHLQAFHQSLGYLSIMAHKLGLNPKQVEELLADVVGTIYEARNE